MEWGLSELNHKINLTLMKEHVVHVSNCTCFRFDLKLSSAKEPILEREPKSLAKYGIFHQNTVFKIAVGNLFNNKGHS